MKKRTIALLALILLFALVMATPALAADTEEAADAAAAAVSGKSLGAGIAIGIAACGGALGMGIAISKSVEGIARQPEAEGKIRGALMIGLVFIETAIIYALLAVILIIFVLN